jgi:hypothetical protein
MLHLAHGIGRGFRIAAVEFGDNSALHFWRGLGQCRSLANGDLAIFNGGKKLRRCVVDNFTGAFNASLADIE